MMYVYTNGNSTTLNYMHKNDNASWCKTGTRQRRIKPFNGQVNLILYGNLEKILCSIISQVRKTKPFHMLLHNG